jgi:hypothetical protein
MTVYDSLHSSVEYECRLFYRDWLGSDLQISRFFYCDCLERQLCYEWMTRARASSIYKRQNRPLVREGAPQKQDRKLSKSNKYLVMSRK